MSEQKIQGVVELYSELGKKVDEMPLLKKGEKLVIPEDIKKYSMN